MTTEVKPADEAPKKKPKPEVKEYLGDELDLIDLQARTIGMMSDFMGATAPEGEGFTANSEPAVDEARADVGRLVSYLAEEIETRMKALRPRGGR